MYTMTACTLVSRVPQYTFCRGYRWAGSCRMATLSQKISHFHRIQDIKNLVGQLQWKHRTALWQSVTSAVLNENHKTSEQANPLSHMASREQISDTLQDAQQVGGTSWWGGANIWGKHIHFKCCEVHWICSRCDNPKQHIHESVSISHLKDTICSVSGTEWQQSQQNYLKVWNLSGYFENIL